MPGRVEWQLSRWAEGEQGTETSAGRTTNRPAIGGPLTRLARILKVPLWRRPGNPLVLVEHGQGRLKQVRPAQPLKPRRDLRVIQVRMIAAVGADQLVHVGVAAHDAAAHDADRLAPQDRLAAVTGLTGGRGCRDLFSRDAQPPVTAIAGMRCGDSARTDSRPATRRRVRGTRTAQLTHHHEVGPATTVSGAMALLSPDDNMQAVQKACPADSGGRVMPGYVEVQVSSEMSAG